MATVRINGTPVFAEGFVWDGCHKIYLIDSPESRQQLLEHGWSENDFRPLNDLPQAWNSSCPLRFISSGDLETPYIAQDEDGTVTMDSLDHYAPTIEGEVVEPAPITDPLTALIAHHFIDATDWRATSLALADHIRTEYGVIERRPQDPPARTTPGWYQRVARDWAAARFDFPPRPTAHQVHIASDGSEWTYEAVEAGQWDITGRPETP